MHNLMWPSSVDLNSFAGASCHLYGALYKSGTNFWMSSPFMWDVAEVGAIVCVGFQTLTLTLVLVYVGIYFFFPLSIIQV